MKRAIEQTERIENGVFTIKKINEVTEGETAIWHFHSDYELIYISSGSGKRHVGSHISFFDHGDLVLLGPDLPHLSFFDEGNEIQNKISVIIKDDFVSGGILNIRELIGIRQLFERSKQGLTFYGDIKNSVGKQLEELVSEDPFHSLIGLLDILNKMALTSEVESLKASGFGIELDHQQRDRIRSIYSFVEEHFQRAISLEEIAKVVNMTVPAFCRFFKRLTQKTFTQFVNEYRISYACQLIAHNPESIGEVCYESGFNNLSHFNKQFKSIIGKSPSAYKKAIQNDEEPDPMEVRMARMKEMKVSFR